MVYRYLADRGISPPFDADTAIHPIGTLRRRSDRDGKLNWLSGQVAPTVRWLIDHGDTSAAMAALGLGEYIRADGGAAVATTSQG